MLRLLADDLTGALDSAAEFTGLFGPVRVAWDGSPPGNLAIDTGTREAARGAALVATRAAAPMLGGAAIAFKKVDSLLRGHPIAELAACRDGFRHVVLAPAFPAMGRVTRHGTQYARDGAGWTARAALPALLAQEGLQPRPLPASGPLPQGIVLCDAEDDGDLARIVARFRAADGPVLWCGSGGLAGALASARPALRDTGLRGPVLGLFGSDQGVTARQLAACGKLALRLPDGGAESAARLRALMQAEGAALAGFSLPEGTARPAAALAIATALRALVVALPRPGTLIVAGGETLRALCQALGAKALEATSLLAPGVPRSRLLGGRWDGVEVISKSGAFGGDALWRDLLAANGLLTGIEVA
ncbi:four-carbon acid sugar kinase family protein [Roseomonas stagni]|uniref:Four-carbon acid sugar kinase family protein n=1 Tax=Falsiroseomonas algicola TaxID=2716930 RepID=A0A6M1LS41_9PROT|nr:four-carbon acid sugar kinase family protein [Falsiroseomonas algicola]NGM23047.1 four-carbon acid sugar kinase family protein [Falsiroseomonas algicola]